MTDTDNRRTEKLDEVKLDCGGGIAFWKTARMITGLTRLSRYTELAKGRSSQSARSGAGFALRFQRGCWHLRLNIGYIFQDMPSGH
ncbi:hypothetical protein CEXT_758361 [Caerostris extrusa]|uniref:Uncharacterized protein n=1 Tax=Caerostris extrusa TaxID=172846 RepID=A0AAV4Y9Q2_CAEEX|nr:hypothetical protein CEXT_758361 [Caerostris extrusa]